MKKILITLLSITILFLSIPSHSLALRCGNNNIVMRGDTAVSVLNKCGQPDHREFMQEVINGQLQYVEKWFYNCGENDFLYDLTFINSIVVKDDPFSRGTGTNKCK
jgi:hypothetical protein